MFLSEVGMGVRFECSLLLWYYKGRNLQWHLNFSATNLKKNENSPPDQTVHSKDLLLESKNSCFSAKFCMELLDDSLSSQQVWSRMKSVYSLKLYHLEVNQSGSFISPGWWATWAQQQLHTQLLVMRSGRIPCPQDIWLWKNAHRAHALEMLSKIIIIIIIH